MIWIFYFLIGAGFAFSYWSNVADIRESVGVTIPWFITAGIVIMFIWPAFMVWIMVWMFIDSL